MNRSWSLKRAEVLVRLLNERGLTLPVDTAVELIVTGSRPWRQG